MVFGLPDDEWGQWVQAVVQPVAAAAVDGPLDQVTLRAALLAWCKRQWAGFKLPRDIAFAELPRDDAGKMARAAVRGRGLWRAAWALGTTAENANAPQAGRPVSADPR